MTFGPTAWSSIAAVHTCTVPQPSRQYEIACEKSETPPIPEKLLSGKAFVSCAIFASDNGRIAGPPSPPLDTKPSTLISNSSVSGSIGGSEGKVLDDTIASAPPRKHAAASTTMSAVAGVSLHHTGTFATSFTASVTTEQRP